MRPVVCLPVFLFLLMMMPYAAAQDVLVHEVGTSPREVEAADLAYPVFAPDGADLGNVTWRVVDGLGNCCEAYIEATPTGRLVEFGGTYIVYSDDRGITWHEVDTPVPYRSGEGTVSSAPGGDIVGVGWDPYSGDQLWAHKYEADEDQWYYAPIPVHTPFYDRPWIAVVPGDVTGTLRSGEYAVLLDGYPTHKSTFASVDGLHYDESTNQHRPMLGDAGAFEIVADPVFDWIQPHQRAQILPLGEGRALGPTYIAGCGRDQAGVMDPDLVWRCRDTSLPATSVVSDSRGWVHHIETDGGASSVTYRLTTDGGETWNKTKVTLPGDLVVFERDSYDIAAHGAMGLSAIAVHALDTATDTHQDLVLRFDTRQGDPVHLETAMVGEGGFLFGASAASTAPRFDFISVTILPDGRVATTFKDATYTGRAVVAIESVPMDLPALAPTDAQDAAETEASQETGVPAPSSGLAAPMARFTLEIDGRTARADASSSWDPDGEVVAYTWDWGDGHEQEGVRAEHTYPAPGIHSVKLFVTDDEGRVAGVERTFRIDPDTDAPATVDEGRALPGPGAAVLALLVFVVGRRLRRSSS